MTWYLGRPGALQQIRPPARDYDRSGSDSPQVIDLLAGRAVQRRAKSLRTFKYTWTWLNRSEHAIVAGFGTRQFGVGPYALIDGATANYLTENQASGGSAQRGTAGFTPGSQVMNGYLTVGGVSVSDTVTQIGDRSVSWTPSNPVPVAYSFGVIPLVNPNFEHGTAGWSAVNGTVSTYTASTISDLRSGLLTPSGTGPATAKSAAGTVDVVPGSVYSMFATVRSPNGWGAVRLGIEWQDATGAVVRTDYGTAYSFAAGNQFALNHAAACPNGASRAAVLVQLNGSPAVTDTLQIDKVGLQRAAQTGTADDIGFRVPVGMTSMTVTVTPASTDDIDAYLYRGSTLVASGTAGTGAIETLTVANPAAGDYTIRVTGFSVADSNAGRYTVTVSGTSATTSTASSSLPGTVTQGAVSTQNLTVPANVNTVTLSLPVTAGLDLDMEVYSGGALVGRSANSAGSAESLTLTGLAPGTYQVDIIGYTVTGTASYVVGVSTTTTPPAAGTATLNLTHPIYTNGFPVPGGTSWTFAAWMQATITTSVTAALVWYDVNGVKLSETIGSGSVGTSGWARVSVTGTAPSGAAYAGLELRAPTTAGLTVYVGSARLALGDASTAWYPGEGLPVVSVSDFSETVPVYDKRSAQLTLVEVS